MLVFLGFTGFYRRFISGFSQIAALLTDLTRGLKEGKPCKYFKYNKEA